MLGFFFISNAALGGHRTELNRTLCHNVWIEVNKIWKWSSKICGFSPRKCGTKNCLFRLQTNG